MKNMNLFQIQGLNPVFGKDSYLNNVELSLAIFCAAINQTAYQSKSLSA